MKFLIATTNAHKIEEISRILIPHGIEIITPRELENPLEDVEETGTTFAENAYLKAKAACEETGLVAIADDSGLCIDALGGRPGIYSARFMEGLPYSQKNAEIIKELENADTRAAHYTCAVCVSAPGGKSLMTEGYCYGEIGFEQKGENGFGYDPIFYIGGVSLAEMSPAEKDKISHRGNALKEFEKRLPKFLKELENADK